MASEVPERPRARIRRIGAILFDPKAEWARIDVEPATVRGIMIGWVAPLAAIGPVAKLIGSQLLGFGNYGARPRQALTSALTEAVVGYALSLAAVYLLARIIAGLAPNFGGRHDRVQAMKVAGYGATAAYLAGLFQIAHQLEWLEALGAYSLYLLFLGLPTVMHSRKARSLVYTVVVLLAAIGMTILLTLIVLWTRDIFTPAMPASAYDYIPPG